MTRELFRKCAAWMACALSAAVLVVPARAHSQQLPADATRDGASADALVEQGTSAYRAGDLERALGLFDRAYALEPRPDLLYNMGRVHESLKHYDQARDYFSRFIQEPDVNTDARRDAVNRMEVIESLIAMREREADRAKQLADNDATAPTQGDTATTPRDAAASDEVTSATSEPQVTQAIAEPIEEDGISGASIASIVLLGAGLAAAGAGLYFGLSSAQSEDDLREECIETSGDLVCPVASREDADAMQRDALIADIAYGTAGALVLTSLIVWAVSGDDETERTAAPLQIAPSVTPDRAGITMYLRF